MVLINNQSARPTGVIRAGSPQSAGGKEKPTVGSKPPTGFKSQGVYRWQSAKRNSYKK